jgi:Outer membrane protein beta-barrel domain
VEVFTFVTIILQIPSTMKKILLLIIALIIIPLAGQAQFKFGLRAGASTSNLSKETIEVNTLEIVLKEAKYGIHGGVFVRAHFSEKWYLQPEVLFNSTKVDFEVGDLKNGLAPELLTEEYHNLDIPVLLGYKIGPIRLEAGPVAHAYLPAKTELDEIEDYEQRIQDFTLGYQAGIGLDIWRLLVDVRFDGNFQEFGEHMYIGDQQINFSQVPTRWVMTLGYAF